MRSKITNILTVIVLFIFVLLFVSLISRLDIFTRASHALQDILTHRYFYTENLHEDNIVIIKIDDKTLDVLWRSDLGILSFDKWIYGELIDTLFSKYSVASVWIDIVFANPSVLWIEDELALKHTLDRYKDRVVIATYESWDLYPLCLYAWSIHWFVDTPSQEVIRHFRFNQQEYLLKNYCWDDDIHPYNTWFINSLPLQLLEVSLPYLSPFKRDDIKNNLNIFKDSWDIQYISYFSNGVDNKDTIWFRSYSFIDILDWKDIDLAGKMILIGEVWTAIHDSHFTPISPNNRMPWVEINANIMETLYQWKMLQDLHPWIFIWIILILSWVVTILVLTTKLIYSIWWFMIICLGVLYTTLFLFLDWWIFLQTLFLLTFLILYYIALYLYRFTIIDKLKRKLKRQFSLYVSPDIVEDIAQNTESITLKWEKKEMTIFFSDIQDFTTISENIETQKLVKLMNEYFHEMTQIIHSNKWTLDKYIWDAVMCFFGAPIDIENHTYFACKTALDQQSRLAELRDAWESQWQEVLKIRIWIHTGEAIHGNIGSSETRVNYTAIGDTVNIASRLEYICKTYGISICVSEDVYQKERQNFYFRELDDIRLKWKTQSVKIYELLDFKDWKISDRDMEKYWVYRKGLDFYRWWKYREAYDTWSKNIDDTTSMYMAERCKQILDGGASLIDWTYIMKHK